MECIHLDMFGPFPQSKWGNKYILVMVDQFSKWVEIHAIPDISAEQTVKLVVIDVLNSALFRVKDHQKEYVHHHDHLK